MAHLGPRHPPGARRAGLPAVRLAPRAQAVDLDLDVPVGGAGAHGGEQLRGALGETAVMVGAHQHFHPVQTALLVEHREAIRLPVHDAEHSGLAAQRRRRPVDVAQAVDPAPRLGGRLLRRRRRWLVRRARRAAGRRGETAAQHAQRQTRAIDRQGQMQMQAERLRGRLVAPDDAQPLAVRARRKIQIRPVLDGCGREPGCPGPPAQIRTCALTHTAPNLGWLTANRVASQLAVSAQPPVTRRPGPASGACFGLADSPWLRPFPPATPQALARPCSPPSPVSGRRRRAPRALASVRRSNGTCGFPAYRFHEDVFA